jgi:hypothetical protein
MPGRNQPGQATDVRRDIQRKGKVRFVTAYPMHASQRRIYRGEDE